MLQSSIWDLSKRENAAGENVSFLSNFMYSDIGMSVGFAFHIIPTLFSEFFRFKTVYVDMREYSYFWASTLRSTASINIHEFVVIYEFLPSATCKLENRTTATTLWAKLCVHHLLFSLFHIFTIKLTLFFIKVKVGSGTFPLSTYLLRWILHSSPNLSP